ncbi:hypothetical protein IH781_03685 [Patescibacteria group bacterium]|nr:hypothetical protein [Patescibacteria group bacterium]
MSKHTELLHALGEYTVNQLLALGVKLGGPQVVEKILACNQLTCQFGRQDEPGLLTDDVDAAVVARLKATIGNHGGVVDEDYALLAQPDGCGFIDSVAQQLVAFGANQRNSYLVAVHYDLAWPKQIEAANLGWITDYDDNLFFLDPAAQYSDESKRRAAHLSQVPAGQKEQRMTLFDPEGKLTTEQVLAKLDQMNLRPTLSAETLAFAKAQPDVQRNNLLIGLGSVWIDRRGDRNVLCLHADSNGRFLDRRWYDSRWISRCRFLAVPFSAKATAGTRK